MDDVIAGDPIRGEGLYYAASEKRSEFAFLLALDNELWAVRKRVSDPNLALIRIQFIRDEFAKFCEGGICELPIFSQNSELKFNSVSKAAINELLDTHFEFSEHAQETVFNRYISACLSIAGIDEPKFAQIGAIVFENAINGNFGANPKLLSEANQVFRKLKREKGELILPSIAFLKLCRSPRLFNDVIDTNKKKQCGIFAKLAVFGAILFSKI